MGGWFVDIVVEWIIRMVLKSVRRIRSLSWPVVTATVMNAVYERAGYDRNTTDLHLDYSFADQDFGGPHEEPLLMSDLAKNFAARFPAGSSIQVRVKPLQAEETVALIN